MDRRQMIKAGVGAGALALTASSRATAQAREAAPLPRRDTVRVAFVLGEGFTNMIDTAGPWEVFQDVHLPGPEMRMPFELFTVAGNIEPRRMTGGFHTRAHHSFADAPQPNLIVVPAHGRTDESLAWLKRASKGADLTMSVCTGAFALAHAGLLDGFPVTTHHDYWDDFAKQFPALELRRGPRFVDSGRVATAGGLTSGIDLALHVVNRYFGPEVAHATAVYMEHGSDAWRTG